MRIFIDTCVLPRCRMEAGRLYRDRFGPELGFELLPMFDLPGFEANVNASLGLFGSGPLVFHEPVWGVEHSAPRGSEAWKAGMFHLEKTAALAQKLKPEFMVYHLNNRAVGPGEKDAMLRTSLENLEEVRAMFPGVRLLVENTGTDLEGNRLLDQAEFTALCLDKDLPALVDAGHANANGWDLPRLLRELGPRIRGFHLHNNDGRADQHRRLTDGTLDLPRLIRGIRAHAPEAFLVIEYTRPEYHGAPLCEDIALLARLAEG